MSFIRKIIVKGNAYYFLVERKTIDSKVKEKLIKSFGTQKPIRYKPKVILTSTVNDLSYFN